MKSHVWLLALLLTWSGSLVHAQSSPGSKLVRFESLEKRTALLELYTSEGCSSCPPAEAWLSRIRDSPGLWKEFVPVAFHVDYWDRLGWADRWATIEHSERQRAYAKSWRKDSVYTPGFVLNGSEWRDWPSNRDLPPAPVTMAGVLKVVSADAIRWASSSRPLPCWNGLRSGPESIAKKRRGTSGP